MKVFEPFQLSYEHCQNELKHFKTLLETAELDEASIITFFRENKHLAAFVGSYYPYIEQFDRLAFEYDLFGDFSADLVIGDSQRGYYFFVEFEDAGSQSIFRKSERSHGYWSARFEQGYSQIIDWFWKLSSMEANREFLHRFGTNYCGFEAMLVIGRSAALDTKEWDRLRWRRQHVTVNGSRIHCITLDELYDTLERRLHFYEQAFRAEES